MSQHHLPQRRLSFVLTCTKVATSSSLMQRSGSTSSLNLLNFYELSKFHHWQASLISLRLNRNRVQCGWAGACTIAPARINIQRNCYSFYFIIMNLTADQPCSHAVLIPSKHAGKPEMSKTHV